MHILQNSCDGKSWNSLETKQGLRVSQPVVIAQFHFSAVGPAHSAAKQFSWPTHHTYNTQNSIPSSPSPTHQQPHNLLHRWGRSLCAAATFLHCSGQIESSRLGATRAPAGSVAGGILASRASPRVPPLPRTLPLLRLPYPPSLVRRHCCWCCGGGSRTVAHGVRR